ncbi:cilia- and flagella-associated protein 61 [Hyposmocoma kahamanoa]|uniref:cilia- and flagella-associated protein 61 n=1 Tax=Hyposmocoma kahamanoa TaxID=1477025 RepID=UPI000E6D9A22|nr:cilia- and flagella-associated protein 61 [Hyposmocoma kahamanoa]
MSIYFDFTVGPKGRRFRKAVDQDKIEIEAFWKREETKTLFNVQSIGLVIERSALSIVMINEQMKVLGLLALTDHPNIPALDPAHWELWIRNMFQKFYLSRDTLFIDFVCCHDSVTEFFLDEALLSVFLNDFYLKHIVLVVSPACSEDYIYKFPPFKKRSPYQYCPTKVEDKEKVPCYNLYVAERKDFCPKMKVRRAVEEDNDDVIEILNEECPQLMDIYGEFYISEIISRHPERKRKVMVSEIHDKVTGVMCLSADVNFSMLQSVYELAPYNGLVRHSLQEKEEIKQNNELLTAFGDPIMLGQLGPFDHIICNVDMTPQIAIDDIDEPISGIKINMSPDDKINADRSRNTIVLDELERPKKTVRHSLQPVNHVTRRQSSDDSHDYSLSLLMNPDVSISLLLGDDDAFEYDIINIDLELMQVMDMSLTDLRPHNKISSGVSIASGSKRPRYSVRRRSSFKRKSLHVKQHSEPTIHKEITGAPNAFIIELLGLRENVDVRRAFDLLEAAFECMQNYDYCAIRVPAADKSLFLLQHFTFVPTKPNICSYYSLYIAHRNSVLGKLRVRRAEYGDIPQIASLLYNLDAKETLWTIEYSIAHPRQHQSYIFLCGCSIIGIAIIESPEDIQLLREEFSLENYHMHKYHLIGSGWNSGFASIKSALIYPVFEPHFRFFTRELLRHSGSSSVVWLTSYRNKLYGLMAFSFGVPHARAEDSTLKQISDTPCFIRNSEVHHYLKIKGRNSILRFYYHHANLLAEQLTIPDSMRSIQKCGLAYDGGLLIDHQFRTNNPSIYAAGTVTRYYRRYFADDKRQSYYDSYEVGARLGEQIRDQLDPMLRAKVSHRRKSTAEANESSSKSSKSTLDSEENWKLPELKLPKSWCCVFPGELNYLEIRPPGMKFPSYYVQSLHFNGFVMETFKHGYFKLHMNREYVVDGITCLTPEPYALMNFRSLYGLSGVVLNYVHLRFNAQKIDDFFEFFTEPWAAFLYNERVSDLMAMVKELRPKNEPEGLTLQEILRNFAQECDANSADFAKVLREESEFDKSNHYASISDYVIEWLSENDEIMPMYLQPWQVVEYYNDISGHPAFKRRKRNFRHMLKDIMKEFRIVCR